jgi:hypothetical protein
MSLTPLSPKFNDFKVEYLCYFWAIFIYALIRVSEALGSCMKKNQRSKISWHGPLKEMIESTRGRQGKKAINEGLQWRIAMKDCNEGLQWRIAMKDCNEGLQWGIAMKEGYEGRYNVFRKWKQKMQFHWIPRNSSVHTSMEFMELKLHIKLPGSAKKFTYVNSLHGLALSSELLSPDAWIN